VARAGGLPSDVDGVGVGAGVGVTTTTGAVGWDGPSPQPPVSAAKPRRHDTSFRCFIDASVCANGTESIAKLI
jgi:hypothetical protein